jgi:ParB-like chromosome segregation protein Spo0J
MEATGTALSIAERARALFAELATLNLNERVDAINQIKLALKPYSPFATEPVDCVLWVKNDRVTANDYNPNSVAPPEMKLLALSIKEDGYTQPIVTWLRDGVHEVVDGFHRNRVGKENEDVRARVNGYLPVVAINQDRQDLGDRMAATVRHNRARGKHSVDAMSEMVIELKRRNRSDEWIAKHLGMDADEVLRLCQISGLTEMFADHTFSQAWDVGIFDDENSDGVLVEDTEEGEDEADGTNISHMG